MPPIIVILVAIGGLFALVRALVKDGELMSTVQRILTIIGMLLIVGFLIQYLYDPFASYRHQREPNQVQRQLNWAKKKWNSHNITDYSFEVEYYSFSALGGCGAIITVRKGDIVGVVETMQGGWEKLPEPRILPKTMWGGEGMACDYSHFTIPKIFDIVQNGIDEGGTVNVSFDPKYGFVTDCYTDPNIRSNALLRTYLSDATVSYRLGNFHRLDPSAQ